MFRTGRSDLAILKLSAWYTSSYEEISLLCRSPYIPAVSRDEHGLSPNMRLKTVFLAKLMATIPLCSIPIDHLGLLHNTYLMKMIIPHLQSETQALAKIMTVCKFSNKAGRKVLREYAEPRELIACALDRQAKYASLIKHVKFFEHRIMWPAPVFSCPQLLNIFSLYLVNTSLFASSLRLFLSPKLQGVWI